MNRSSPDKFKRLKTELMLILPSSIPAQLNSELGWSVAPKASNTRAKSKTLMKMSTKKYAGSMGFLHQQPWLTSCLSCLTPISSMAFRSIRGATLGRKLWLEPIILAWLEEEYSHSSYKTLPKKLNQGLLLLARII